MLALTLVKDVGASGTVGGIEIVAPLPSGELVESPMVLVAVTLA